MTLTAEERDAAIRLANHQREEQGVPEHSDDHLLLDRIATLLGGASDSRRPVQAGEAA